MKRLRIEKWGPQFLLPRTRPLCPYHQSIQQQHLSQHPHNHRPQPIRSLTSTSRRPQQQQQQQQQPEQQPQTQTNTDTDTAPRLPLEHLPSPPVSTSHPSAKLSALHSRLSLPARLPLQTLARTLVDASADPDPRFNNASLALLGADLLAYHTAEHLLCHYPRLPMAVLYAAQYAYIGPKALAAVAREWGVEDAAEPGGEVDAGLLQFARVRPGAAQEGVLGKEREGNGEGEGGRNPVGTGRPNEQYGWRRGISSRVVYDDPFGDLKTSGPGASTTTTTGRQQQQQPHHPTTLEAASRAFVHALAGALYLHCGRAATKRFHASHILTRQLDLSSLFSFTQPTRDLSRLCAREGFEPPIARLVSETGRLSRAPVFVVGVYSGRDKLGEGAGASLDEARVRAAAAAMKSWYLYSPAEVVVPSEVEGAAGREGARRWVPNLVDMGEVIV